MDLPNCLFYKFHKLLPKEAKFIVLNGWWSLTNTIFLSNVSNLKFAYEEIKIGRWPLVEGIVTHMCDSHAESIGYWQSACDWEIVYSARIFILHQFGSSAAFSVWKTVKSGKEPNQRRDGWHTSGLLCLAKNAKSNVRFKMLYCYDAPTNRLCVCDVCCSVSWRWLRIIG